MKKVYYSLMGLALPWLVLAKSGGDSGDVGGSGGSGGDIGGGGNTILVNPLAADNIPQLLNSIINFLLALAAPIATIMVIYAGYLLIIARDNEDKVKEARKTLLFVVLGVLVLILSKGIVSLAQSFLK